MEKRSISDCGLIVTDASGVVLPIMADSYYMLVDDIEILYGMGAWIEDFNHVRLSKREVLGMCGVISNDSVVSSGINSLAIHEVQK